MRIGHALATCIAAACGAAVAQTAVLPDGPPRGQGPPGGEACEACSGGGQLLTEGPRPPSLPEAAFERIDQALRDRVATADTADALFVRGLQATMDPGARVSGYAEAYRRQPAELLFLASLADACMVRAIPAWPECASLDPVSRWASRDADNALPRVLLAERARQRSDLPGMREQLLYGADLKRFDSYRARGGVAVWRVLAGVPGVASEPESPFAAAAIGAARADLGTVEAATVCRRDGAGVTPEVGEACRRLGRTMADRADTWEARQVGLAILWSWTDDAAARARLAAEREKIEAASLECNNARLALIEALNRDAASRSQARAIETGAIDDALKLDEPALCAKLVARARQAKFL